MEKVKEKYKYIVTALQTLEKALGNYTFVKDRQDQNLFGELDPQELFLAQRDSLIQRFEYSFDLFWKYLKTYLEDISKVNLERLTPRHIIKQGCLTRILSEDEASLALKMIEARNRTSHIYREEVAERVADDIPQFYCLMQHVILRLDPEIDI